MPGPTRQRELEGSGQHIRLPEKSESERGLSKNILIT